MKTEAIPRLLICLTLTLVVLLSGASLHLPLISVNAARTVRPQRDHSSVTGDIITPRAHPSATLLSTGKVLIACGYGSFFGPQLGGPLNSAELYDPVIETWSSTGNLSITHGGEEFTSTLLPTGKVLVVGGSPGVGTLSSAELYDPVTETWSPTGRLIQARARHTATLLPNGEVLVVGGDSGEPLRSAELYNPTTGTWRPTGNLNFARSYHTATLLPNGQVLVVEGYGGGTSAELYNPTTGTWSPTGNLFKSYYWHTATLLPNGKVLVVGSLYFGTNTTTELYDPASGTWTITGPLNFGRLYHTATLLPNGKVLVLGGTEVPTSRFYDTAELYDPSTGTWTPAAKLNTPRAWHTATLLQNGKVLVAGGGTGSGLLASTELYDPGATSSPNPVDDARFFVRQHYLDFLNREPDQGGWDYWTAQINACGNDPLCIHHRRITVSAAFFIELEFQQTGYVVYRIHRGAFGTWPSGPTRANLAFAQFMADRSQLVPGAGLLQSTVIFANNFVQRSEFLQAYPDSMTNAQFVNKLFDTAGLLPYTNERQQQINEMNNNGKSRARVLLDLIEINEFKTLEYDPAFVLMQYFGYLRRDPDQAGYDFWLNILQNREPNNYRSMVCAFLTSAEYQRRFGNVVTHTNAECA